MLKILIIDDEECVRSSLSIHLKQLGYAIETAASALEYLRSQTEACRFDPSFADVVLVDQCMPGMSGLEFLSCHLAQGDKGPVQHLAVMSAFLSDEDQRRAGELGCRIFVKPFSLAEIEQWLEAVAGCRPVVESLPQQG